MSNIFSRVMATKTNEELEAIIRSSKDYQPEAVVAALEELDRRKNSPDQLAHVEMPDTPEWEEAPKQERRRDLIELLKPDVEGGYIWTPIIIYLNVAVFVLMVMMGVDPLTPSVESLIEWGGNIRFLTLEGEQWRLLTSTFLHGGLLHLAFNMYALLYVGMAMEKTLGSRLYLVSYLACGILASIASISTNENIVSVGASGAVFGMYGVFLALLISKKLQIPPEARKSLTSSILLFVGFNLLYGFSQTGIDNAAHIGGLVSGVGIAFAFMRVAGKVNFRPLMIGIGLFTIAAVIASPLMLFDKLSPFEKAMISFYENQEQSRWMINHNTVLNAHESAFDSLNLRLLRDGIEPWDENIKVLDGLEELPSELRLRVSHLREYSVLVKDYFTLIRDQLKSRNAEGLNRLNRLSAEMQAKVIEINALLQ